jgi:hypothetical protein
VPRVVADDQLPRLVGELLRSRQIGGPSVMDRRVEEFEIAPETRECPARRFVRCAG